ncbi:ATP-dependent DNA helicase RecG [Clostridium tetanomorphum]|uniref:ATP-dependent DNA helicase RecG n=1 Tax=Clostridium tetanomorphum TaxID=1553 RepID=A0A923J2P9_CLOTT|nr:ATP-dependent DNA helicase RecG [Clostridium tetanomorphum]KAJ51520.1 ATP-dependent DNA helicase RecG [Clostridium tetanomorphum DSM 665]MBC2398873.1 ATP-dependent DNA helicase RecG [Clostridium tetanomorphum]NRS84693.1 ATP-dependent DNA helicase RecG [Clostridium tetanomorphum]NRZ97908.1 ATP-dependent DNA helicase RecG [Clostridium tetanomorphum]
MDVYSNINCIKGVGPKTETDLNKCGIYTVMDLLLYFPRDYKKVLLYNDLNSVKSRDEVILFGNVVEIRKDIRTRTGKILSTVVFEKDDSLFKCKWFNQPYIKNYFRINKSYILKGKIDIFNGEKIIVNPTILKDKDIDLNNKKETIMPIYPLRGNIKNNTIAKLIKKVLSFIEIEENLPEWIIEKYRFCSLDKGIRNIHNPINNEILYEARRRLKFQELFTYSLKILMLKEYKKINTEGISFNIVPELKELKDKLPFKLTNSQSKVIREILLDSKRPIQMNRLVQGDVGSGKTIVGILSMFNVVRNGYQAVLMAPTEILAQQHYKEVSKILNDFNLNIRLLSGSTPKKEKEQVKKELKEGKIDIIIGTHALIEDDVEFYKLGFVITDEQHRFGVIQRSKLFNKGTSVDVLVMTATPIPRTLALYLYGDLDVSIIDELPPGRQKIDTYCINKKEKGRVYSFALKEIHKGRQVYIVCPLVDENNDLDLTSVQFLYEELKNKYFRDIDIAILHGKMKPKEKNDIMNKFKNNEIKVLISTTVIEVGINVPNATLMIIENAERFGLAQLHQLRGRVGRGGEKSYCILIADIKNSITKKRMETMVSSNDGFYIAEQDLKIRGSGEIFGFRQHGEEGFILSDIMEDIDLLKKSNSEAKKIISSQDEKDKKIIKYILCKIDNNSKYICFN